VNHRRLVFENPGSALEKLPVLPAAGSSRQPDIAFSPGNNDLDFDPTLAGGPLQFLSEAFVRQEVRSVDMNCLFCRGNQELERMRARVEPPDVGLLLTTMTAP
jgi:hypothetical protein